MANTANLELVISLKDQASKGLGGISKSVGALGTAVGVFAGGAALAGVQALGSAVSGFFSDAITESRDAAKGFAQTTAAIKSTGGAANVTADQIVDLAGSLSKTTLFTDDSIQGLENLMLTFTGVRNEAGAGNDIFTQSTKIALDMATALGTDAAGGAIQLGKALNDPTKGIAALTRVGVTFTEQQKNQIKTLQASGDMLGAQKIILAELSKEFGGSAEAAAKADGGFHLFQQRMDDVKQTVGDALMPALTGVMSLMAGPVLDAVESLGQSLAGGLTTAVAWLTNTGIPALTAGWQAIQPALTAVGGFIKGTLIPALMSFGGWIVTIGKNLAAGDWPGAFAAITTGLADFATTIGTTLLTWGQAFLDWVGPLIPPLLAKLGEIATTVVGWIGEQVPVMLAKVGEWGSAFIAWVPTAIADIQAALPGIWTTVSTWIGEQVGPILTQVSVWGSQFVAWIPTAITDIQAALPGIWTSVSTWITETATAIVTKLVDWGTAFVAWIGPAIPGFIESVGAFAVGIGTAIVNGVPVIVEKVKLWADALVEWITTVAVPALTPAFDVFMANLRTGADRASVVLSDAGNKAGIAMTDGLKLGWANAPVETNKAMLNIAAEIDKARPGFMAAARVIGSDLIDSLVKSMNESAGIKLPSVQTVLIGIFLGWGPSLGIAAAKLGLDFAESLFTGARDQFLKLAPGLNALGASIATAIYDGLNTGAALIGEAARKIGAAIITGMGQGLGDIASWVAGKVIGGLNSALALVRANQGIRSPSTVWAEQVGSPLAQGIAEGFTSGLPRLMSTVRTGVTATVGAAVDSIQSGSGGVAAAIQKLLATGDFAGGIFGKDEDDPFIDFLLTARKDATALANVLDVLKTGDFKGGILGLSEDDPFILALLKAAEAAKKIGGSHIGPANTGGSAIGPLKEQIGGSHIGPANTGGSHIGPLKQEIEDILTGFVKIDDAIGKQRILHGFVKIADDVDHIAGRLGVGVGAINDASAGMSIAGPNLGNDFVQLGNRLGVGASLVADAANKMIIAGPNLGNAMTAAADIANKLGKGIGATNSNKLGVGTGAVNDQPDPGGTFAPRPGAGEGGLGASVKAGSDAGVGFSDAFKTGLEQSAAVIQDTTRMTFQQLHEVVLLPWQEDTRTFFGGAGFGFIGAASEGIMSAGGGLAVVAGAAGGMAGSALAAGLQGSVPAATAAIGAVQAALNDLKDKTVTITIHTVHTDDGGGGSESNGFLDGLRGIGAG